MSRFKYIDSKHKLQKMNNLGVHVDLTAEDKLLYVNPFIKYITNLIKIQERYFSKIYSLFINWW